MFQGNFLWSKKIQAAAQSHAAFCCFSGVQLLAGEGEQGIGFYCCHFQQREEKQRVTDGKDALERVQVPQSSLGSKIVFRFYSQNSNPK